MREEGWKTCLVETRMPRCRSEMVEVGLDCGFFLKISEAFEIHPNAIRKHSSRKYREGHSSGKKSTLYLFQN